MLVTTLRLLEELARLIRKNSVLHIIHFSVHIALLLALQGHDIGNLEGKKGGLGTSYIFGHLIQITFRSFDYLGVIFRYALLIEQRLADVGSCFYGLDPR